MTFDQWTLTSLFRARAGQHFFSNTQYFSFLLRHLYHSWKQGILSCLRVKEFIGTMVVQRSLSLAIINIWAGTSLKLKFNVVVRNLSVDLFWAKAVMKFLFLYLLARLILRRIFCIVGDVQGHGYFWLDLGTWIEKDKGRLKTGWSTVRLLYDSVCACLNACLHV